MRQTDGFAPSTVITAVSCMNSKVSQLRQKLGSYVIQYIIKKLHKKSASKQASVFTMEQTKNFVMNAPKTIYYNVKKIIALTAIQGELRVSEIVNLEYEDITLLNNGSMIIRVKSSNTDQAGRGHTFVITPNSNSCLCLVARMKSYMNLLDPKTARLFSY